jgi:beta-barrel assembly-enhancing protease
MDTIPQRYPARCYLSGRPASEFCELELGPQGLEIYVAGQRAAQWAYPDLQCDCAGDEKAFLVISNPSAVDVNVISVVTPDPVFRAGLSERVLYNVKEFLLSFDSRRRAHLRRQWAALAGAALACLGLAVAGYLLLTGRVVSWAAEQMPVSTEVKWGNVIAPTFLAGRTMVSEGPALEACAQILARLTNAVERNPGYPFTVAVVKDGMVNALALPGGHIVVFTGLLERAGSAEEVAGVLAHELQHILKRHVVKRVISSLGTHALVWAVFGGGNLSTIAVGTREIMGLSYSRQQEREADQAGLRLLVQAGISPESLASFFEKLRQDEPLRLPELISTHPATDERIKQIRQAATALTPAKRNHLDIDWTQVRQNLP